MSLKLLIGLGNPGPQYENTYHNAGTQAINYLISQWGLSKPIRAQNGKPFHYTKQNDVIIAISDTFMNESGLAVSAAAKYFKLDPISICVIHDDSDISLGECRLGFGHSSAGHHGVESTIKALGTKNFWRLRIGVRPHNKNTQKAGDFVLVTIPKTDQEILQSVFSGALQELIKVIENANRPEVVRNIS